MKSLFEPREIETLKRMMDKHNAWSSTILSVSLRLLYYAFLVLLLHDGYAKTAVFFLMMSLVAHGIVKGLADWSFARATAMINAQREAEGE